MGKHFWEPHGYYELGVGLLEEAIYDDIIARFKLITCTKNLTQLAFILRARKHHLRTARKMNIMPIAWVDIISQYGDGYYPFWILTGDGPPRPSAEKYCSEIRH